MSHPLRLGLTALVAAALLASTGAAYAAFTTPACLAKKQLAWTNLRKCQGTEAAKGLLGKPTDLAKCQTKFDGTTTKIAAKAADAAIACRYRDNSDGTVTDYDTGLQWEKKLPGECSDRSLFCLNNADCLPVGTCVGGPHYVRADYSWHAAQALVGGTSPDGSAIAGDFAGLVGHSDWRLPTIVELNSILDTTQGQCGGGSGACINSIFGPTGAGFYWSATTAATNPDNAWFVSFLSGNVNFVSENSVYYVRGVRSGL